MQGRDSIESGGKIGFRGNSCMNMCKDMCGHEHICVYAYCIGLFMSACMSVGNCR